MTVRYRFDPGQSRFTVQAFATGLLSFLGHSPTFAVRDFAGELTVNGADVTGLWLTASVRAGALELVDQVSAADRRQIEDTMRRDVLESAASPEVTYRAEDFAIESVT